MSLNTNKDFSTPSVTPQADCPSCGRRFLFNSDLVNRMIQNDTLDKLAVSKNDTSFQTAALIKCSHCQSEFELQEIASSLIENTKLTQAISAANSILTANIAIYIYAALMVINWYLSTLISELEEFAGFVRTIAFASLWFGFAPMFSIIYWFILYRGLKSNDVELFEAKRNLKKSFAQWLAATISAFFLLKYQGWFNF